MLLGDPPERVDVGAQSVVAVQPNTPQADKFDPAAEEKVLAEIERLTSLATVTAPGQLFLSTVRGASNVGAKSVTFGDLTVTAAP